MENQIADIYEDWEYSPVYRRINTNRDAKFIQRDELYFVSARRKSFEEWFPNSIRPERFDYEKEIILHLMIKSRIAGKPDLYFGSILCRTWEKQPNKIMLCQWDVEQNHPQGQKILCDRSEWRQALRAIRTNILSFMTGQPHVSFRDGLHNPRIRDDSVLEKWRSKGFIHPHDPEYPY